MNSTIRVVTVALFGLAALSGTCIANEEHGHCSGTNVCQGDAACEKAGHKEMTKDECIKIDGAKFEPSSHENETHNDPDHQDEK